MATATWRCLISFCRGRDWKQNNNFLFLSLNFDNFGIQLQNDLPKFDEYTIWNKRDKVWGNENSLFKWRFRLVFKTECSNKVPILNWLTHKAKILWLLECMQNYKVLGGKKNTGPVPDCKARGLATFSIDIFNTVSTLVKPLLVKIALIRVKTLNVRRPTFWFMLF